MAKAQVIGVDKFRTGIAVALSDQRKALGADLRRLAGQLAEEIKDACPSKTGALRNSIRVVERADGLGASVQVGDAAVYYASYVEYGTSRAPAHPFVRPAVEKFKRRLPSEVAHSISQTWGGK
jgi:HK97 gp10 family phage protein